MISPSEQLLVARSVARADFAVVGGVSVILNDYPRSTRDVDILVSDRPANPRRVLDCLAHWGEGCAPELTPADFVPQEGSIRVEEDLDRDIVTRMRGKSPDDFRPRLRCIEMQGVRTAYRAPWELIFRKQDSWHDKDKRDVAALRALIEQEQSAP